MTAPTVAERMAVVARSLGLPRALRAGITALLEQVAEQDAALDELLAIVGEKEARLAELEAEVAELRSPEWQQEQIDAYHGEVAKLRAKREKLYE